MLHVFSFSFSLPLSFLFCACTPSLFHFARFVLFRLCFIFFFCFCFTFFCYSLNGVHLFVFPGILMFEFMGAFEYENGQDRFLLSLSLCTSEVLLFFFICVCVSRMRSSARGSLARVAFVRCACVVIVIKIYDCFPLLLLFHTFSL